MTQHTASPHWGLKLKGESMFSEINKYYSPTIEVSGGRTLTQRLEYQKGDLEARLKKVNDALAALEKNPEIQNVFDLVSKIL